MLWWKNFYVLTPKSYVSFEVMDDDLILSKDSPYKNFSNQGVSKMLKKEIMPASEINKISYVNWI